MGVGAIVAFAPSQDYASCPGRQRPQRRFLMSEVPLRPPDRVLDGPASGKKGSKGGPSLADPLADLAYRGTSLATGVPKQPGRLYPQRLPPPRVLQGYLAHEKPPLPLGPP